MGLVFIKKSDKRTLSGKSFSFYQCDLCGKIKEIQNATVKRGQKSCGCLNKENGKHLITHGMVYSKEYSSYRAMKERCLNEKSKSYKHYGGRGITMCDEWIESFENFYKDMGERPSKNHSIDRIDVNKGYSKENCQWTTSRNQALNRRNGSKTPNIRLLKSNRYQVRFYINGKEKIIGCYDTLDLAQDARLKYINTMETEINKHAQR